MASREIFLRLLISFFTDLGQSIGTQPLRYILLSLLAALFLSSGLVFVEMREDVRGGYLEEGSPSVKEHAVYLEFMRSKHKVYAITMIALASDGGSIVREKHLDEVVKIADVAQHIVVTPEGGQPYSLANHTNYGKFTIDLVRLFQRGVKLQNERIARGEGLDPDIILDYPYSRAYGHKIYTSNVFYGVNRSIEDNPKAPTKLDRVWLLAMCFMMERTDDQTVEALKEIELRMFDFANDRSISDLVTFEVYGDEIVNREILRSSKASSLYFLIGLALMVVFVTSTVVKLDAKGKWLNASNAILVCTAIASPMLAASSVLGILSVLGQPINSMMCIMPFLLLGIGVDDAFLLIHGWRITAETRGHLTRAEKLSKTLASVGPSITITSVTNTLAFSVGALMATPQVRAFCVCTAVALFFDLILEVTIFSAVVAFISDDDDNKNANKALQLQNTATERFLRRYSKAVMGWPMRIFCFVCLLILWTTSIMGIATMGTESAPEKTFEDDSRVVDSLAIIDDLYNDHEGILLLVNRPPRMDNATDYQLFKDSILRLKTLPYACDMNVTGVWLDDYEKFESEVNAIIGMVSDGKSHRDSNNLPEFLEQHIEYNDTIRWSYDENGNVQVDSFAMWLCLRGTSSWYDRGLRMLEFRNLVQEYPMFNMTIFVFDSTIFDVILTTVDVTVRAVICTLISMIIVCFLFIPSHGCLLVATCSIASIVVAVVGYLSWWNCDLDVIGMVNILMAIGFTVDFTAHISFHYCKTGVDHLTNKEERLYRTFDAVAWPMIQAGLSTVICVLPLVFYNVYLFRTFVKTVLLTSGWGTLHGLVFLPVALACLPNSITGDQWAKKKKLPIIDLSRSAAEPILGSEEREALDKAMTEQH